MKVSFVERFFAIRISCRSGRHLLNRRKGVSHGSGSACSSSDRSWGSVGVSEQLYPDG